MNYVLLALLTLTSLTLHAQESTDIFLKTRFDYESSFSFVKRLRAFLMHNNFGDPYNQTVKKPIVIDLNKTLQDLPPGTQAWVKDLQNILQIKIFESSFKVIINDLSYSIKDFNSELKPTVSFLNRVEYVTQNYVQGLTVSASSIAFEVGLKKTTSGDPITFAIELVNPEFNIRPEVMVDLNMGWLTSIMPEYMLISLQLIDMQKLFETIAKKPELVDLTVKDLKMPQVSIRIGSKEISFNHAKIKTFFTGRREDLKKGILDLIQVRMGERLGNIVMDSPRELIIPRTYALQSTINAIFDIQEMSINNTKLLQVDMDGHFCKKEEEVGADFCWNEQIPAKMRRKIPRGTYNKSVQELSRTLIEKDYNLALSVSEHYLNQLIQSTRQAGLWERDLSSKDFQMGPESAFVLAEEKGETFSLYIDVIHQLKGVERLMVGRSELRFPIKFGIGLNIVDHQGTPQLRIKVIKILTDEKLLLAGLPDYGMLSDVKDVRFKKKIIKAIMKDVNEFKDSILVEMALKEFKGTYLEELEFASDGRGRANAILRLGKRNNGKSGTI